MSTQFYSQDQIEKMTKMATEQAEDFANMGKNGFEAWVESANIWMNGTQNMFKTWSNITNAAREQQAKAMKEFMSCKTINDMTETGSKLYQQSLEQSMSQSTQLTEQAIKTYMDSVEPINDQMTKSFQNGMKKAQSAAKKAEKAA
jgi:phasin family protein